MVFFLGEIARVSSDEQLALWLAALVRLLLLLLLWGVTSSSRDVGETASRALSLRLRGDRTGRCTERGVSRLPERAAAATGDDVVDMLGSKRVTTGGGSD